MSIPLTTDWDVIQERNIDPFSPVHSDNHNKLLKIMANHKAYIKGFDITYIQDVTNNRMLATLSSGICMINYVVIDMLEASTIIAYQCPITERRLAIVIEYSYRKVLPAPVAVIKCIPYSAINHNIHLVLYTFWVGNWATVPTTDFWLDWLNDNHYKDERVSEDNIPQWAIDTFVLKAGDTMRGRLYMYADPVGDMEAATKNYVDYKIANHDQEHDDRFVRKAGDTMTGFLYLHAHPIEPMHAATKQYVDELCDLYVRKAGDTMTGELINQVKVTTPILNHPTRISFYINNIERAYVDQYGLIGALYNSDFVEFFNHNMKQMPDEGLCVCLDSSGKVVLSSKEADTSVIGLVSYHPGLVLGGTTEWEVEFKNGRLPVALVGQINDVIVESKSKLPPGTLLVSGLNGTLIPLNDVEDKYKPGCIIAKTLFPLLPGKNIGKIVITKS